MMPPRTEKLKAQFHLWLVVVAILFTTPQASPDNTPKSAGDNIVTLRLEGLEGLDLSSGVSPVLSKVFGGEHPRPNVVVKLSDGTASKTLELTGSVSAIDSFLAQADPFSPVFKNRSISMSLLFRENLSPSQMTALTRYQDLHETLKLRAQWRQEAFGTLTASLVPLQKGASSEGDGSVYVNSFKMEGFSMQEYILEMREVVAVLAQHRQRDLYLWQAKFEQRILGVIKGAGPKFRQYLETNHHLKWRRLTSTTPELLGGSDWAGARLIDSQIVGDLYSEDIGNKLRGWQKVTWGGYGRVLPPDQLHRLALSTVEGFLTNPTWDPDVLNPVLDYLAGSTQAESYSERALFVEKVINRAQLTGDHNLAKIAVRLFELSNPKDFRSSRPQDKSVLADAQTQHSKLFEEVVDLISRFPVETESETTALLESLSSKVQRAHAPKQSQLQRWVLANHLLLILLNKRGGTQLADGVPYRILDVQANDWRDLPSGHELLLAKALRGLVSATVFREGPMGNNPEIMGALERGTTATHDLLLRLTLQRLAKKDVKRWGTERVWFLEQLLERAALSAQRSNSVFQDLIYALHARADWSEAHFDGAPVKPGPGILKILSNRLALAVDPQLRASIETILKRYGISAQRAETIAREEISNSGPREGLLKRLGGVCRLLRD